MRPAWTCLPAAILAAFLGAIATPSEARASSAATPFANGEISLRRPDASQFMESSRDVRSGSEPDLRRIAMPDSIQLGPDRGEPAVYDDSTPHPPLALTIAVSLAVTAACVAAAILVFRIGYSMMDALHSESPLSTGRGR